MQEAVELSIKKAEENKCKCWLISVLVPVFVTSVIMFYVIDHYSQYYSYEYIFSKILGTAIVAGSVFIYVP